MSESGTVIRERRKRERDQRIQSIVEAAKRVFFAKGYLKATMDEIALEAEVSKPTIYLYFKTKDDLFFTLMQPVIDDIAVQMGKIEKRLTANKYATAAALIHDWFKGLVHSYETAPDTFQIIQLFQQTNLVSELSEETRSALDESGRANFETTRRVIRAAIEQGLIREVDAHGLADVVWAMIVGIIQLEDIKSHKKQKRGGPHLQSTLNLAEQLVVDALAVRVANAKG